LLADKVSGLVIAYGIIAALFHRERTGQGQRVEIPMIDAVRSFVLVEHGGSAITGDGPSGYPRILTALRGAAATADGWIALQPHRDKHWDALVRAAGLEELVGDPRLTTRSLWREPGFGYTTLRRVMATRTTAEWLAFCEEHGIPAAPAAGIDDLIAELPEAEHPAGPYKVIPPPVRFSATPTAIRRPAPLVGQHTREVLTEAGLSDEQIAKLAEAGVLRTLDAEPPAPPTRLAARRPKPCGPTA